MPPDDTAERTHHLRQLHDLVGRLTAHDLTNVGRRDRVRELRNFYEKAMRDMNNLISRLPRRTLNDGHRKRWLDEPYAVLQAYADAEGLW